MPPEMRPQEVCVGRRRKTAQHGSRPTWGIEGRVAVLGCSAGSCSSLCRVPGGGREASVCKMTASQA